MKDAAVTKVVIETTNLILVDLIMAILCCCNVPLIIVDMSKCHLGFTLGYCLAGLQFELLGLSPGSVCISEVRCLVR